MSSNLLYSFKMSFNFTSDSNSLCLSKGLQLFGRTATTFLLACLHFSKKQLFLYWLGQHITFSGDHVKALEFKLSWIPTFALTVCGGDSMLPIQSESYIVGKYIESFDDIKNNKSYIILTDEDILYKQVRNKINEDGSLHLISNNKYYPTIQIEPESVLEIWQFTCFISTKDMRWVWKIFSCLLMALVKKSRR